MLKKIVLACLPIVALSACSDAANSPQGSSRSEIRIVGSSTVFPFAKAVSESYVNLDRSRPSPILESTGTGAGIELFCAGIGAATPDIANASRRMNQEEFKRCIGNGVTDVVEIIVGFDGIAVAQSIKTDSPLSLSLPELYRALAAKPSGAETNTTRNWSDISPSLPATPISIYGPPPTSGTRDALVELLMEAGCKSDPAIKAMKDSDEKKYKSICHDARTDGKFIEAGENDNLIVQKIGGNPRSVGIFGFSFLDANLNTLRGIPINGVQPTYENIASGKYPGARAMYIYVKKAHLDVIPGIREFITEFLKAGAPDGYLVKSGLIVSPEETRKEMDARLQTLTVLDASELN